MACVVGLGARLVAGLLPGGVASGLRPSGTSSGPMGRRARGAPRDPRLTGVAVLERGRPGPRLINEAVGVPIVPGRPLKVGFISAKIKQHSMSDDIARAPRVAFE